MSERRDLMWREWEKQWKDYPSQDNEGYQPDRGSYKAGFLDGFKTADVNPPAPSRDKEIEQIKIDLRREYFDQQELDVKVSEAVKAATLAERERCAELVDRNSGDKHWTVNAILNPKADV